MRAPRTPILIVVLVAVAAACALAPGSATAASAGHKAHAADAAGPGGVDRSDVRAAQRALGLDADGVLGPQTRRAIRRFQAKAGLRVDGVLGPQTLRAIRAGADDDEDRAQTRATTPTGAGGATPGDAVDDTAPTPAGDLPAPSGADAATLASIAECESGGDPKAISKDGRYRGKYQFDRATWARMGGSGDPAVAPEAEQDARAAKLLDAKGTAPWPVCGAA